MFRFRVYDSQENIVWESQNFHSEESCYRMARRIGRRNPHIGLKYRLTSRAQDFWPIM